jgi:signal transduction histidine kinase
MAGILKDSLGETDEEATREMLEVLNDNAEAAQDRVDDLLKLAESGQKPAEVENIDIGEVIDEILEGLSSRTKENVSVVVYDDMGSITASKPQIRQVFSNLIINAIKHNDSEEPEVRISRMGRTNGTHVFLVQDNGSGIHPEDFETIFTPFRSGRKTGETGIGLSIARKIARIYGGDIRVYKDNGACFEVTLNDYQ